MFPSDYCFVLQKPEVGTSESCLVPPLAVELQLLTFTDSYASRPTSLITLYIPALLRNAQG